MTAGGEEKFSGLSIASLVTGILSLFTFNPLLGIAAIICGAIDLPKIKAGKSSKKSRKMDIAGIVLGAVDIIATVILVIMGIAFVISRFSGFGLENFI